jgi:predicted  nucleic acid-binding Zn-ribbon protein
MSQIEDEILKAEEIIFRLAEKVKKIEEFEKQLLNLEIKIQHLQNNISNLSKNSDLSSNPDIIRINNEIEAITTQISSLNDSNLQSKLIDFEEEISTLKNRIPSIEERIAQINNHDGQKYIKESDFFIIIKEINTLKKELVQKDDSLAQLSIAMSDLIVKYQKLSRNFALLQDNKTSMKEITHFQETSFSNDSGVIEFPQQSIEVINETFYRLIKALIDKKEQVIAEKSLEEYLSIIKTDYRFYHHLGIIKYKKQEYQLALEYYNTAIELASNNVDENQYNTLIKNREFILKKLL